MQSTHKKVHALAAALLAALLLSGCGTPGTAPNAEEVKPDPKPSVFYYYDENKEWHLLEDEARSAAGVQLYVDAAADAVVKDLTEQLSYTEEEAETLLAEGGLEIYLCMDPDLQTMADTACSAQGDAAASSEPLQAAAVLLDTETGNILALSGSSLMSTYDLHIPGTALAPLSVYAPVLEQTDLTPDSMVRDEPYEQNWPVNPSGSYHAAITMTEALCSTSNCVPVTLLEQYLTPEESAQFVRDAFSIELVLERIEGERTLSDLSLAGLALGGLTDGVSVLDMAAAYSVFPRGGKYVEPRWYTTVVDRDGNALLSSDGAPTQVLADTTASAMTDMLKAVVANGAGAEAQLEGQTVAGMPGVTASGKDEWFVGYTPNYTAAVWCGYESKTPIAGADNPAVGLWKQVMQGVSDMR